ncbi:MAG: UDP binding domain-containing protein [Bacteroidia bacterium]|nr:UDP binding domain-containing protein [Bacteroidia bacterium]
MRTCRRLCERLPGADADVVTRALGQDSRIGGKYLKGAISYGGPCFPRDNLALIAIAQRMGVVAEVAETTDRFNRAQNRWLADFVYQHVEIGAKVGILGFAYKAGSDVVEESPAIYLARYLSEKGISLCGYDPVAQENARRVLGDSVEWMSSAEACIENAAVVVIPTPWPQFKGIAPSVWQPIARTRKVIDCWRFLPELAQLTRVQYIPLGQATMAVALPT